MAMAITTRLSILVIIFAISFAGAIYLGIRARSTRSDVRTITGFQSDKPALLMFSSKTCPPCDKVQKPIIRRLLQKPDVSFNFYEIDVENEPEIANKWNVLTVPTIFLLDRDGKVHFGHHGIVTEKILTDEIRELE